MLAHVEHARERIGGEHGAHLALDRAVHGISSVDFPATREGIGPRRPQGAFQARGVQSHPPIDGRRFCEQEPIARVARVDLRGRDRRAADEPGGLLHGQQAVEGGRCLRFRRSGIRRPGRIAVR